MRHGKIMELIKEHVSLGLKFLYENYKQNFFDEASSVITFGINYKTLLDPHLKPILVSKMFGVAIILNMLLDICEYMYMEICKKDDALFKYEDLKVMAGYIISNSQRGGGWSYYPHINSIPPDADDTGWALLALYKIGYDHNEPVISRAINKLVENIMDDGFISTWLVGRNKWDVYSKWLGGIRAPEVSLIALAALIAYEAIDKETAYWMIRQIINQNTSVEPVWYPTKLYTYFVASILASLACKREQYENVCKYIVGWLKRWLFSLRSTESSASVLERSYRLRVVAEFCTLEEHYCKSNKIINLIEQDVSALARMQRGDGSFPPEPFHMYIPRDNNRNLLLIKYFLSKKLTHLIYYESACVTTAIALGSLARCYAVLSSYYS